MLFADFLNYAMDQSDLTNYKLAKRIGVSQSTIANWANGITEPREKRRSEVLALFGVDEYDLEKGFPEIHYSSNGQKEKPALQMENGFDADTKELFDIWNSEDEAGRKALIEMARFLKSKREK